MPLNCDSAPCVSITSAKKKRVWFFSETLLGITKSSKKRFMTAVAMLGITSSRPLRPGSDPGSFNRDPATTWDVGGSVSQPHSCSWHWWICWSSQTNSRICLVRHCEKHCTLAILEWNSFWFQRIPTDSAVPLDKGGPQFGIAKLV